MPRSNSVIGGRSASLPAICPNTVAGPVRATSTRAVPLLTLVPRKTQLLRSARLAFSATTPGLFSTGKVSPVSTAWLTKQSFDSSTTPSPGTRLPADSSTTSPGTTRLEGRVLGCPSRTTDEWIVTLERSFSMALPAMYSCPKPSSVLPSTMASTTAASTHSPANTETMEATTRISTSGFLNWLANRRSALARRLVSTASDPCCFNRMPASRRDSPSVPDRRLARSLSAGRLQ